MIYANFEIELRGTITYILFQCKDYNDLHKQLGKIQQQMMKKIESVVEPETKLKCKVTSIPVNFKEVLET